MTESFWGRATRAVAQSGQQDPDPEPLDPASVGLSDWGARRGELGIADSGDFIGIEGWQRPTRYIYHEPTDLERYAGERAGLGVRDAPQSRAGAARVNPSPHRIV